LGRISWGRGNSSVWWGAENAKMEKARLENAAPYCRVGKRETGKGGIELRGGKHGNVFFMESHACLLVWFADA